ncbi:MAG: hypothetical protein E6618_12145 [Staphylococcus warneri]|nr:hypothetical protein [Staphylococcus warneri]
MVLDFLSSLNIDHLFAAFDFNAWTVDNLLKNAGNTMKRWVALALVVLGAIVFLFGGWLLSKVIFSQQQKGSNAMWSLIALAIGGLLMYNGFNSLNTIGKGLSQSVKDLGK